MKLIIPIAGSSSRFPGMRPKWMLTMPNGDLMLERAISGLKLDNISELVIIALEEHIEKFKISKDFIIEAIKLKIAPKKIKINLIDTGRNTMTGGRLKRLKKFLNETFLMTYGDGLSDVNINKLVNFHRKNKKIFTLTAVRPPARFGSIKIKGNFVNYFNWIIFLWQKNISNKTLYSR